MPEDLRTLSIGALIQRYPFLEAFFESHDLSPGGYENLPLGTYLAEHLDPAQSGITPDDFITLLERHLEDMLRFLSDEIETVRSITILPGFDKSRKPEGFESLTIRSGEIVSIVGPTGSGKSRLLADIDWMAQGDTPTGRKILINGKTPDVGRRFSPAEKLVAQLSQNMNFVMDLSVEEFLHLHAESRMIENMEEITGRILEEANRLAGESFSPSTPITSLSGGQSRALMIADTAILSRSPIILIDEIENAGIDRVRALELLLDEKKIVLMATHDPVLALMGGRRIIISGGGVEKVIRSSPEERDILRELEIMDRRILQLRNRLRRGERLDVAENPGRLPDIPRAGHVGTAMSRKENCNA